MAGWKSNFMERASKGYAVLQGIAKSSVPPVRPGRLGALRREEDVGLQFVADVGVAPDDFGESLLFDKLLQRLGQIDLIPEPVAVAHTLELIFDDGEEGFAHHRAGHVCVAQTADPDVD